MTVLDLVVMLLVSPLVAGLLVMPWWDGDTSSRAQNPAQPLDLPLPRHEAVQQEVATRVLTPHLSAQPFSGGA